MAQQQRPMIVVFGNIKGGNGKSTLAVHVSVDLMYRGWQVACIDCDGKQGTLSRYWENRQRFRQVIHSHQDAAVQAGLRQVPLPCHTARLVPYQDDHIQLQQCVTDLSSGGSQRIIVMDTAGYDAPLSRYAHGLADVLITPMNDSAFDLDLLVNVTDSLQTDKLPLSQYALLVWEQRMRKASSGLSPLKWLVVRNRMHTLASRNQVQLGKVLHSLAGRIGFHMGPCVTERVIFRELFGYGLTILDHNHVPDQHRSAVQEVAAVTDFVLHSTG